MKHLANVGNSYPIKIPIDKFMHEKLTTTYCGKYRNGKNIVLNYHVLTRQLNTNQRNIEIGG